jgi:hypothetical protein
MCLAPDRETLSALKRSAASAEWELAPGAVTLEEALDQIEEEKPHILVVWGGDFAEGLQGFLARALEIRPAMRVVSDRELPGATVVVGSPEEVRAAILARPRPDGPVG